MKSFLFVFLILLCSSCSSYKNVNPNLDSKATRIICNSSDTITVKQDSTKIELYSKNYYSAYDSFSNSRHSEDLFRAMEYDVLLSPTSLQLIKDSGGMRNIFKTILSKENYEKFGGKVPLTLHVIISLESLKISEYYIRISTIQASGISISNKEIIKLYEFCKKMSFVYSGTEFKDETVPAGWIFGIYQ